MTNPLSIWDCPSWDSRIEKRRGFSLLEVMLATAILASSALVLSSLLGLGAKFGSRAEARTEALSQAQSLLDEFLARPGDQAERDQDREGVLPSTPERAYRIRVVEAMSVANAQGQADGNNYTTTEQGAPGLAHDQPWMGNTTSPPLGQLPRPLPPSRLMLVSVEVFDSPTLEASTQQWPLCQLSQLVRWPAKSNP